MGFDVHSRVYQPHSMLPFPPPSSSSRKAFHWWNPTGDPGSGTGTPHNADYSTFGTGQATKDTQQL